ncbi:unnamed protein product [Durusdinium trenchii]|uniref:Uncharacterized protein n=1 Tax=Durusdinium trenchii TaxID=1381693 RepID=A0ABP0N6D6_9DINO
MALPTPILEDLEWAWEELAASTETMMRMREEDRKCFESQGSKSLDKTARLGAVRAVGATCSDSHWSKAVLLLDRYSSYCASLPKLPLTCAAIARIVAKLEIGGHYERDLFLTENSGGWMVAQDFATWVGMTFGCTTEEITDSTLSKHEFEVLKALDWKVDWPCLEQWLHTISARFSVLTGAQNNEQLQMMMRSILISARAILTTEAPHKLSHGDLAMGLFGAHVLLEPLMGTPDELGEAGRSAATCPLLNWRELRNPTHPLQEWSKLFIALKPGGNADRASSEASSRLLDATNEAQQDEKEIGKNVQHAVRELQDAFRSMPMVT